MTEKPTSTAANPEVGIKVPFYGNMDFQATILCGKEKHILCLQRGNADPEVHIYDPTDNQAMHFLLSFYESTMVEPQVNA
jgi:hypothetical protein